MLGHPWLQKPPPEHAVQYTSPAAQPWPTAVESGPPVAIAVLPHPKEAAPVEAQISIVNHHRSLKIMGDQCRRPPKRTSTSCSFGRAEIGGLAVGFRYGHVTDELDAGHATRDTETFQCEPLQTAELTYPCPCAQS
jgi:hypothetical protein